VTSLPTTICRSNVIGVLQGAGHGVERGTTPYFEQDGVSPLFRQGPTECPTVLNMKAKPN
jgi:hypothetical protein